jgi:hypothetical protein
LPITTIRNAEASFTDAHPGHAYRAGKARENIYSREQRAKPTWALSLGMLFADLDAMCLVPYSGLIWQFQTGSDGLGHDSCNILEREAEVVDIGLLPGIFAGLHHALWTVRNRLLTLDRYTALCILESTAVVYSPAYSNPDDQDNMTFCTPSIQL